MAHKDNRNWNIYNEKLVKRGEFYLRFEPLDSWDKELGHMNREKKGRPFEYPKVFVLFSGVVSTFFNLPYRQLEGVLRKLEVVVPKLKAADYTTLFKRMQDLRIIRRSSQMKLPKCDEGRVIAIDSTGIKVTNRGEWLRKNWKGEERKGWIKVHIAVDVETKELVSIKVTDEKVGDCKMLGPLLRKVKLKDALLDGAYDTEDAFKFFNEKGVNPPGIKISKNASPKGLSDRAFAVREFQKLGYDKWKRKHHYGKRWTAEGFFSAVKRCFGESVRATSAEGMILEVKRKFSLYNTLLSLQT